MSLRAVWDRLMVVVALMALGVVVGILLTDVSPRRRPTMTRRDTLGHQTPCSEDCANEPFCRFHRPETSYSKRAQGYPLWARAIVLFLALALAAAFGGTFWPVFTNVCEAQTARADSTAFILYLDNFTTDTVVAHLARGPMLPYDSLGFVPPHEHRWFVVTSATLGASPAIRVAFTWGLKPSLELSPIVFRFPDRPTSIIWYVGDPPAKRATRTDA